MAIQILKFLEKILNFFFSLVFRKAGGELPQSMILPMATFSPWKADEKFKSIFNIISKNTLVDKYRCYELWQLCKEVAHLKGNCIEIGVWRGGTGVLMAKCMSEVSPNTKNYLCDTFQGVVMAGENDNFYVGNEHADTSMKIVQDLIDKVGLKNIQMFKGIFPNDTGHLVENDTFKLVHIDVDVYEGAKSITEWIWPKLEVGGIIVYDDYGFFYTRGVTKFVESQRQQKDRLVIHNLNGHAVIVKTR